LLPPTCCRIGRSTVTGSTLLVDGVQHLMRFGHDFSVM